MFSFATQAHIAGLKAHDAFEFLLRAEDADFQAWWPGMHHRCIILHRTANHVGTKLRFVQTIGPYHVNETARITEVVPDRKIVRQVIVVIPLPIYVTFELAADATGTDSNGTTLTHTIHAGYGGFGALLDPLFRIFFTRKFIAALDEHLRYEFELLREVAPRFTAALAAHER